MIRRMLLIYAIGLFTCQSLFSQDIDLSDSSWNAKIDSAAEWQNDVLYLPSELPNLSLLPVNEPTGGWENLKENGKQVSVPLTMDEYFLGGININTYEGVSWAWRTFDVPANYRNKVILLNVEKVRMRAEVYINQQLAAYDIIGETPFTFDISKYLKIGASNTIAIRITNPGGRRGWLDLPLSWNKYTYISNGKNFSTIGHITINARPRVYTKDVFVKNILPVNGKKVEIKVAINNTTSDTIEATIPVEIFNSDFKRIAKHKLSQKLNPGLNEFSFEKVLDKAELWSPDNPNLYICNIKVNALGETDAYQQTFGVRTFQVLEGKSGEHNFYLNGERFFFKTAIDWGFYTPTGDYATPQLAERSVKAAKAMNLNGLNFHRTIGEPLVMDYADKFGLCIYEEPGGFNWGEDTTGFSADHIKEKLRRMVIRDRNHPSVIMYNLSNENHSYNSLRKECLELINELDNSRLVTNSSGVEPTPTPHIRPYESEIRTDYRDQHTADNRGAIYNDNDFYQEQHRSEEYMDCIYVLGEVNSVTGPENWYNTYESILPHKHIYTGYDLNIYEENHFKIKDAFDRWELAKIGSGNIKKPGDVSMQAGRGMMYAHARHAQSVLINNNADGLALNGWSTGPQSEANALDWASGILDEGRFLKGPAECFTYWARPLQIAIARKNGKYFHVNDTVVVEVHLVNQGKLKAGEYTLHYSITDGKNITTHYSKEINITVEGGERFAQYIEDLSFITQKEWNAGYITLKADLKYNNKTVTTGSEQILLQNRSSFVKDFKDISFEVRQWNEAFHALKGLGHLKTNENKDVFDSAKASAKANVILIGDLTGSSSVNDTRENINEWNQIDEILKQVEGGEILILKFDKYWAQVLERKGVLSSPVTEWGGNQTTHWLGNGWGYLDHFVGDLSTANKGTISTNSWEVPNNPYGFYPFESDSVISVYGLYLSRPWLCKEPAIGFRMLELQPTMTVTLGVIDYGKGKIILNPCYWVDENNAFTDMLFYNIIIKATNGEW